MEYYNTLKQFSAYSALFNLMPNSTFMREGISNKVQYLYNDENGVNLKINNEERLKTNLYNYIRDMYNNRIHDHNLLLKELPHVPYEDMIDIIKLQLKTDNSESSSGKYITYPRTFYCEKCGDYVYLGNDDKFENFNPKKCRNPNCDGQYNQFQFVGFCEECGNILPCYQGCKEHQLKNMELIRRDKDDIRTWKLKCRICGEEVGFVPTCFHKDFNKNSILNDNAKHTFPLNMNDGSVFKSVVKTIVDIPDGFKNYETQNEPNPDYILFGLYLQKFDELYQNVTFKKLNLDLNIYYSYLDDEDELEEEGYTKQFEKGNKINEIIEQLEDEYSITQISEINDYLILTRFFDKNNNKEIFVPSYNEYFESNIEISENDLNSFEDETDYETFKKEYNISNITYIPDIHLITASIGKIRGINKFYDEHYVPHFEPHWKDRTANKLSIYAYPFQTEGLIIDLDKIKIVNWLIKNKKLTINQKKVTEKINSYDEAKEILFRLEEDKEDSSYYEVKKLLHTFAHILISRSSLYTGLDVNSCGEIIFPKSGAFVIYSTSNINIGGFKFVFENSLKKWFNEVKLDVSDCIFDPTCIQETGACFSCLHLPEYVCSEFNEYLDRDVFIGEHRYNLGFWNEFKE